MWTVRLTVGGTGGSMLVGSGRGAARGSDKGEVEEMLKDVT